MLLASLPLLARSICKNAGTTSSPFTTMQRLTFSLFACSLISVIVAIGGCGDVAPAVRKLTYPPDFQYLSGQELRTRMAELAYQLQLLDQALAPGPAEQLAQQQQVVQTLSNIERIGASLQPGEAGSTHAHLKDFMAAFRSNVRQARDAASMDPPQYYLAGTVAGGCINCHRVNR